MRIYRVGLFFVLGFFVGLCSPLNSHSQDATGRIMGNVSDPNGDSVPSAAVTITNIDTRIVHTTVTDASGYFQVLSLAIGKYDVTVESDGFQKAAFTGQVLHINQVLRVDAKLAIGTRTDVVNVTEHADVIETVNHTLGQVVTGRTLTDMPLNGRDALDLAKLQPGVTEANPDSAAPGNFSIAGGRPDSVTLLYDGGLNTNLFDNSVVFNPNPDAIAEFRLLTSNYAAEYGRNGGGIISVVTKSGTNNWHGSAFDFLRNDAFDANRFFNKNNTDATLNLPRTDLKRNQFGATFGGPIVIPRLVHGKDRFFFFVAYQGQRQTQAVNSLKTQVFTPDEVKGDFSHGAPNGGADPNVACFLSGLNHNTGDPTRPDGSSCGSGGNAFFQSDATKAFNGIIDPATIVSVAQNYFIKGLIPTDPSGFVNQAGASRDDREELTAKLDFAATKKDALAVTLGWQRNPFLTPFPFASVLGYASTTGSSIHFLSLAYTRTFSPNLLNEFRFTTNRSNFNQDHPVGSRPKPSDLGIAVTPDNPTGPTNLFFSSGLATGFSENGPSSIIDNTFAASDSVTWVKGRHNWKFGGGAAAYQNNTVFDFIINGEFDFNGSTTGSDFADFLIGAPSAYFQSPAAANDIRTKQFYAFAQDEWHVRKNLTVNIGLRYEYSTPKYDTHGRTFTLVPGQQSRIFTKAPLGLNFPGDPHVPSGVNYPNTKDFAPRFGFAWDIFGDSKTSLRGGIGRFFDVLKGEDNFFFNGQSPFYANSSVFFNSVTGASTELGSPFNNPNTNPFPVPNPFPSKLPPADLDFAAAGFLPFSTASLYDYVDPHLRTPYIYHFDLSLQRELVKNMALEVSYVGSSSHGLTAIWDANPFVLGTPDRVLNGNCNALGTQCPFASAPMFGNVSGASYNSLEASVTKQVSDNRFFGTSYFTLAYTWAHNIDNASGFRNRNSQVPTYSMNQFRASSDLDVAHRITFSGGWDLPFERAWNTGPKKLTKGWSLYPIVTWRTGFPIDVGARLRNRLDPTSAGPSADGAPYLLNALLVGPLVLMDPHSSPNNQYFAQSNFSHDQCGDSSHPDPCIPGPAIFPSDAQAVANPSVRTYGSPRNFFRALGLANIDMTISKTTPLLGERLKMEIRADAFNLLNHTEFTTIDHNINSSTFGQVIDTADPRIIQLAVKVSF